MREMSREASEWPSAKDMGLGGRANRMMGDAVRGVSHAFFLSFLTSVRAQIVMIGQKG